MVTKKEQKAMMDYLVDRLRMGHSKAEPFSKTIVGGEESHYIVLDGSGILLLVDRKYPGKNFIGVFNAIGHTPNLMGNAGFIFYKDGKTFFRSTAHGEEAGLKNQGYKQRYDLSLKNYTPEQMRRMITFRPEERHIAEWRKMTVDGSHGPLLQYYQPRSERLQEMVVSYPFKYVEFDYSHVEGDFVPEDRTSERLHIWGRELPIHAGLVLKRNFLYPQNPVQQPQAQSPSSI